MHIIIYCIYIYVYVPDRMSQYICHIFCQISEYVSHELLDCTACQIACQMWKYHMNPEAPLGWKRNAARFAEPEERPQLNGGDGSTSSEENEADLAASIVGHDLALDLAPQIQDVVIRHVISGRCHVAKDRNFDPSDGEAVVLRCGKVASRNIEQVSLGGSFLPYKCSRCFTGD
jgi:hypothetical protein